VAALVLSGTAYWTANDDGDDGGAPGEDGSPPTNPPVILPPVSHAGGYFALTFTDPVYSPSSLTYPLPLSLDGVRYYDDVSSALSITGAQASFLRANGLVGLSTGEVFPYFYDAYDRIVDQGLPVLVTSDMMLDAYHLMFEGMLMQLEQDRLFEEALNMSKALMLRSDLQRAQLPSEHQPLAELNVAFFGAALRLLDPNATVPTYVEQDVQRIIALIDAAQGQETVLGFHKEEDFTQYKPRGHYTRTEELEQYFKAMMWYGRRTFWGKHDDETQRALLIAYAMRDEGAARAAHGRLSAAIDFIVGTPDDLTWTEYLEVADQKFGSLDGDYAPMFDTARLDAFQARMQELRPPQIQSDMSRPEDWVWGLRVFGQRFVLDSYIFQNCVYSKVPKRFLPSGLDVMAVLGSKEAWEREPLTEHAPELEQQLKELSSEVPDKNASVWNQSLYWAWLHTLRALHNDTDAEGYPAFMRTDAWDSKELNTQLASWTQLTHDTLLYRKQSYSEYISLPPTPELVYVEPVPELYSRMEDMVSSTIDGLRGLGLLTSGIEAGLGSLADVLGCLERVALAELSATEASKEDLRTAMYAHERIRFQMPGSDGEDLLKTVLVSDVHTDLYSGRCLEEGVGYVRYMVAVVPTRDGPAACVGAVFVHHEFAWPLSEGRLTDEDWKAMLDGGTAPAPAAWAQDFIR
jgi:hypothetical protein